MQRKELKLSSAVPANSAVKKKNMEMRRKYETRVTSRESQMRAGSALILAVVLTSLLAVLGMMFVMVARVDRIATSAISENKDLDSAVEAVIAKISQELVSDVPGVGGQPDYYDYPDGENAWLASLEPYKDGGYKWRQISDVYNRLGGNLELDAEIIPDYQESSEVFEDNPADADGDGVADSKWVELDDITSNKGRAIYAAVRIIDNGAMLNVNTAYEFDPTNPGTNGEMVDGSSQTQINLFALAQRSTSNTIDQLNDERYNSEPQILDNYIKDVVWRYYVPEGEYTPFDLSDELELRNRYTLNREDIDSRIEEVWDSAFQSGPVGSPYLSVPVSSSTSTIGVWGDEVYYDYDVNDPNVEDDYSYRHIGTTYNMDRIIRPDGGEMLNVNTADADSIYDTVKTALSSADPNFGDVNDIAAQIAVNLIDYRDTDSNVTAYLNPDDGETYYGFESPCIYISELAHNFVSGTLDGAPIVFRSYAIELYKPYREDDYAEPNQWRLIIDNSRSSANDVNVPIDWSGTQRFHVLLFEDPNALLTVNFESGYDDPNLAKSEQKPSFVRYTKVFDDRSVAIELQRLVDGAWLTVDDYARVRPGGDWLRPDVGSQSIQKDITRHKCIRRLWDRTAKPPTLGSMNAYGNGDLIYIQAHPANQDFTNIGEIGMIFCEDVYSRTWNSTDIEADVRFDLTDSSFQQLFKYLTVFDPSTDFDSSGAPIDNDGDGIANETELNQTPEFKIPGRININTAPWFVIAQLPWMQYTATGNEYQRAQEIVNSRTTNGPYENIGELMRVLEMRSLDSDGADNLITDPNHGPDLTVDSARDDFEERDVIFARISNLVTVRSDVFTAYILIRVGADGPQKRVIAILDRSDVYSPNGKVRIVALHPVPDPR